MRTHDPSQPGPGPIGLAIASGWARVVTGVFAMAVLTTTWHALSPTELAHIAAPKPQYALAPVAKAAPMPTEGFAAGFVEPRQPEMAQLTAEPQASAPAAAPVQVVRKTPRRLSGSSQRHAAQGTSARGGSRVNSVKLPPVSLAPMKARSDPWSIDYDPIAHTRLTRKRSDVRNEYLASREQVAAFTGEDSGSGYLARQAVRQTAARTAASAREIRQGHDSRGDPSRS